jgi:hypothetical protein
MEKDGALIEQSRGRPDAFVEFVQRHEVAVHGFLARRGGRELLTICSARFVSRLNDHEAAPTADLRCLKLPETG